MKRKSKCYARFQGANVCDGCKSPSTKCPYRGKFRDLKHSKKPKRGIKGGMRTDEQNDT